MKKQLIVMLFTVLEVLITKENFNMIIDGILDLVEDLVAKTDNTIDDKVVLPVIKRFREYYDIPDNDAPAADQGGQGGFIRSGLLVFILGAFLIFGAGCQFLRDAYTPAAPICDQAEYSEAAICKIFHKYDLEPEMAHGAIVDAARIEVAVRPQDYDQVAAFSLELRAYLNANSWLYFSDLFAKTKEEQTRYRAAAGIISDRLKYLDVNEIIDQKSREIIIMGLDDFDKKLAALAAD